MICIRSEFFNLFSKIYYHPALFDEKYFLYSFLNRFKYPGFLNQTNRYYKTVFLYDFKDCFFCNVFRVIKNVSK